MLFYNIEIKFTSSNVSSGNSGAKNVIGCCSTLTLSLNNVFMFPISVISGKVIARVPNGIIGVCLRLLFSAFELDNGNLARGPLNIGELLPIRGC